MKAITVKDEKLLLTDVEMPNVNDDEIRIKIRASKDKLKKRRLPLFLL